MPTKPQPEENPDYRPEALRRIAEWKRADDLDAPLDFHDLKLGTLPPELFELKKLRSLALSLNRLTSLPPEIGRLRALRELYLDRNQLTTLPSEIGQLTALTWLVLCSNRFTTLPPEIGQLTALKTLYLSYNQLTTLPPELGQLTALARLYLSGNQLTTLPPELGQLTALTRLDLTGNKLATLPPELGQLTALAELSLHDNPGLGLPPEVLGLVWQDVNATNPAAAPRAILDYYFRNRAAKVKRPILEAKVILVGWGKVGKTSLRRRLVNGSFDAEEAQTHKIEITPWPVRVGGDAVRLHLWDFGGQEIMHATHQFFLTKRSLYVLVLAGREKLQGAQEAEYWLRLIASFGGGSPVLVVLNKQHGCPFDLNRQSLMEKYPFIRGFVQTDCEPALGLAELKARILAEVDALPELRTEFDARWLAIKDAVTDLKRQGSKRITVADYLALCARQGEREEKWQRWLLGFLHDLGVVVCFHDDPRLANDGVLDPQWVVDGIYTVLNDPKLKGGDGLVTREQVRALLPREDYGDDDVRVLLEMMEKFELCFAPHGSRTALVVPELMTEQETEWRAIFPEPEQGLGFELKYDFLPEGLVPRFLVATHDLSRAGERWRSGVILRQGKNAALVRGDAVAGRVGIVVNGPEPTRRELLAVIRREFAKINGSIAGLVVRERVPVPGLAVEPLEYEHLLAAEGAEPPRTVWPVVVDGVLHEVSIARLLEGIEPRAKRQARAKERAKGGMTFHVAGDAVFGDKGDTTMQDDHSIHARDITNSQVGQTLMDCTNMIQQMPAGQPKELLEKLLAELEPVREEMKGKDAKVLDGHLAKLTEEVQKPEPDRGVLSLTAQGVVEAAETVGKIAKPVVATVGLLLKLFGA